MIWLALWLVFHIRLDDATRIEPFSGHAGGNVTETEHPMIMRASEKRMDWEDLKQALLQLDHAIKDDDYPAVRSMFFDLVDGYQPESGIVDVLHQQKRKTQGQPQAQAG